MAKNKEPLTYRQNVSRQEAYRIIKAVNLFVLLQGQCGSWE